MAVEREISNPLGLDFPWDLVSMELPSAEAAPLKSVRIGEEYRPIQHEKINDQTTRVWFMATVRSERKAEPPAPAELKKTITFGADEAPTTMKLTRENGSIIVENGLLAIRFADSSAGGAISTLPAPVQGIRLASEPAFYGKTWWEGSAVVKSVKTEVLASGPVFVDIRTRYEIEGSSTKLFPGDDCFYEITARVALNDPWVQIRERYRLPADAAYQIELKEGLKPDTAMWIPWFGYERFGGNVDLRFHPLQPQAMQRGPFVQLRPVWNQKPGSGQDFLATRGGEKGDSGSPAVGFVASHASWWNLPTDQLIDVTVENGDTARAKFPVGTGARAYGLIVGRREQFDNTGKMNNLVRRHSDWTLDDQINRRVLEWKRDPNPASPRVMMRRDQLLRIQGDWTAGRDTWETRVLKEYAPRADKLKGIEKDLFDLLTGKPVKSPRLPNAGLMLERRYQDDFLNPTSRFVREMDDLFAAADLLNAGKPWAGPVQAAVAAIFTDTNHWPGYLNGWQPGNPNFHTDKYVVAAYAAAAMPDHPHSSQWMDYAIKNFQEDTARVLLPIDGVGYECPGYSGYSLQHQLKLARVFLNSGIGNLVADNELFKKSGQWHRHLLTPMDVRLKHRHEAPIGDTHKWIMGANNALGMLGTFYKDRDPAFAGEMMATWRMLREQYLKGDLVTDLLEVDQSIASTPLDKLDWGSHAFNGFGSVMRSRFGDARETFVSFKAGAAKGHYHNDELSFHFYGCGIPLSLDYNCSYSPRADHAALHNSMTFGVAKPFKHIGEDKEVPAMEQLTSVAKTIGFKSTESADAIIAERSGDELVLTPVDPNNARFQYAYPTRKTASRIVHRRTLVLVKHPAGSKLNDYLVIRDETRSPEPQFVNIHLLSRDLKRDGQLLRAEGQWDTNAVVYFATDQVKDVQFSRWFYFDASMNGPGEYNKRDDAASDAANKQWAAKIRETDGQALIPPKGWDKEWKVGEYQQWARVETPPGTAMTWVLYPQKAGDAEPKFETTANGVKVTLGTENETVELSPTQTTVERDGKREEILKVDALAD